MAAAGFPAEQAAQISSVLQQLWEVLVREDATLVEVNPAGPHPDGRILALDGKVTLDSNADYRHASHADLVDNADTDPLGIAGQGTRPELRQTRRVGGHHRERRRSGHVHPGCRGLRRRGVRRVEPANFLDIGGGASAQVMANGLDIVLNDPQVKAVFVNVFGGITACDAVANGIVGALDMLAEKGETVTKPIVCRIDGNNAAEGRRILDEAEHEVIELVETMDDAARAAWPNWPPGPEERTCRSS